MVQGLTSDDSSQVAFLVSKQTQYAEFTEGTIAQPDHQRTDEPPQSPDASPKEAPHLVNISMDSKQNELNSLKIGLRQIL